MSSEDDRSSSESAHLISLAIVNAVFSLFGIIGNTLVLIVLYKNKEHFLGVNIFIAALAVSDLLLCSIIQPVLIYLLFGTVNKATLKVFEDNVFAILIQVSMNLLLGIAIFRFVEILYPFFYRSFATKARIGVVIAVVCIVSVTQGLLFNNNLMRHAEPFFEYATIVAFLVLYGKIYFVAREHQNKIACQTRSLAFNHSGMTVSRLTKLKNSTLTTGIITGAFVVCVLPFSIVNLIHDLIDESDENEILNLWVTTILCCNSSINAYIYTLRSKSFKIEISKTLGFIQCSRQSEEL